MPRKTRGDLLEDDVITGTPVPEDTVPMLDGDARALVVKEPEAVSMFERLARDPNVDPDKLQKLIVMHHEEQARVAKADFDAAFVVMQGDLPTINEDGAIVVDGKIRSRYSTNENLQEVIRPILKHHGFGLTFRNITTDKLVTVRGILVHKNGHQESDEFASPPDSGGSMNAIQRIGSTRSYGARYTTIALLNIVSRAKQDRDDDGVRAVQPDAPDGYAPWLAALEGPASEGTAAFARAWNGSRQDWRTYAAKHDANTLAALRMQANQAGKPKP